MIDCYTCILGGYDNLRIPNEEPNVRYLCYTDEPRLDAQPWRIQPALLTGDASHDSRMPKILSHLHTSGDFSAWMDGCFNPRYVRQFIDEMGPNDVVAIEHPRLNAFREAEYCRRDAGELGFGNPLLDAIDVQLARYRAEGYPGEPFVCGGLIGRRETPRIHAFNELWWREYRAGQKRDQFSLSYALWKSGVRLKVIRGVDVLQNPWFSFHFHAWCHDLSDNPAFAPQRQRAEERRERLGRLLA